MKKPRERIAFDLDMGSDGVMSVGSQRGWNYRVIEYADGSGFGLHQVFYKPDGEVYLWVEKPIYDGSSPEVILAELLEMCDDAKRHKVFSEAEWKERLGK